MSEEMYKKLAQAVIDGESEDAMELAQKALDQGLDPLACITHGLTKGIQITGELFATGDYYLPEMIIGADAMKAALEILEPAMVGNQQREVVGTVVIGTVEGELTASGFRVIDIGVDKSAAEFIAAIRENNATIVAASALLTTTMLQQQKLIDAIEESGLRDQIKVMVGGAPVTQSYADQIGADGFAEDAISAVNLAFRLADAPA